MLQVESRVKTVSQGVESKEFSMKFNGNVASLLSDNIYSDKVLAVTRELCTNAYDADVNKSFTVTLPSDFQRNFIVKDSGTGLSEEQIYDLYTTYFSSGSVGNADKVGGFGLGSKAPLALVDSFTVKSTYEGKQSTYLIFKDNGVPKVSKVGSVPTDDHRGLEVILEIPTEFHEKITKHTVAVCSNLISNNGDAPTIKGLKRKLNEDLYPNKVVFNKGVRKLNKDAYRVYGNNHYRKLTGLLNNVEYPISVDEPAIRDLLNDRTKCGQVDLSIVNIPRLLKVLTGDLVDIQFLLDPKKARPSVSRESLSMDKACVDYVNNLLVDYLMEAADKGYKQVVGFKDSDYLSKIVHILGHYSSIGLGVSLKVGNNLTFESGSLKSVGYDNNTEIFQMHGDSVKVITRCPRWSEDFSLGSIKPVTEVVVVWKRGDCRKSINSIVIERHSLHRDLKDGTLIIHMAGDLQRFDNYAFGKSSLNEGASSFFDKTSEASKNEFKANVAGKAMTVRVMSHYSFCRAPSVKDPLNPTSKRTRQPVERFKWLMGINTEATIEDAKKSYISLGKMVTTGAVKTPDKGQYVLCIPVRSLKVDNYHYAWHFILDAVKQASCKTEEDMDNLKKTNKLLWCYYKEARKYTIAKVLEKDHDDLAYLRPGDVKSLINRSVNNYVGKSYSALGDNLNSILDVQRIFDRGYDHKSTLVGGCVTDLYRSATNRSLKEGQLQFTLDVIKKLVGSRSKLYNHIRLVAQVAEAKRLLGGSLISHKYGAMAESYWDTSVEMFKKEVEGKNCVGKLARVCLVLAPSAQNGGLYDFLERESRAGRSSEESGFTDVYNLISGK